MKNTIAIIFALFVSIAVPATSYAIKGDEEGFRPPSDSREYDNASPVKGPWNVKADQRILNDMLRRQDILVSRGEPIKACMAIPNKLQQNNCLAQVITNLRKDLDQIINDSIATCRRMTQGKKSCVTSLKHAKDSTDMYFADMTLPFAFEGTDFEQPHVIDTLLTIIQQWERTNAAMKLN